MKNYTNDKLDIAFSAERSIQDGIAEISSAEAVTVIISYLIMFLYVTFALGKIKSLGKFLVRMREITITMLRRSQDMSDFFHPLRFIRKLF